MDINAFWSLIDKSRKGADDPEEQAERLGELLQKLPAAEIVSFDKHYRERLAEAYRWDLWAIAYIVNGGCSDDGFDYFCDWLIAQGRDKFEKALANPEAVAGFAEPGECEAETMRYAAQIAHEETTGKELPDAGVDRPDSPVGTQWEEEELEQMYPKAYKKFFA